MFLKVPEILKVQDRFKKGKGKVQERFRIVSRRFRKGSGKVQERFREDSVKVQARFRQG